MLQIVIFHQLLNACSWFLMWPWTCTIQSPNSGVWISWVPFSVAKGWILLTILMMPPIKVKGHWFHHGSFLKFLNKFKTTKRLTDSYGFAPMWLAINWLIYFHGRWGKAGIVYIMTTSLIYLYLNREKGESLS